MQWQYVCTNSDAIQHSIFSMIAYYDNREQVNIVYCRIIRAQSDSTLLSGWPFVDWLKARHCKQRDISCSWISFAPFHWDRGHLKHQ